MATEINLLPFICEAFGHQKKIHKDLDRLYQQKKYVFYRLARKSKFYNHPIIKEGNIYREEYAKKSLGILIYVFENQHKDIEIKDKLFTLIQKGWMRAYMYVNNHDIISLEEYLKPGINSNVYKTDDDFNTDLLMVIWLAAISEKQLVEDEILKKVEHFFLIRLEYAKKNSPLRHHHGSMEKDLLDNVRKLKHRIYNKYGHINSYDSIFHETQKVSIIAEQLSYIMDTENLSLSSLFNNIKMREKDIEEILGTYYMINRNKNAEEALKHLIWGFILKGMAKAYKQLKQYYFENNKETLFIEIQNNYEEINDLKTKNKTLQDKVSKLENQIEKVKTEAEAKHLDRIKNLENEVNRLETELHQEKEKDRELVALREFVFSLDKGLVPNITEEKMPDLSNTTGVIVGGHPRWQKKMMRFLPKWVFINSENFDPRILDGFGIICFYTQYLGHGLYYKAIGEARKRGLRIGYVGSANEELALREIADIVNKFH